jgi:hypothetical protein
MTFRGQDPRLGHRASPNDDTRARPAHPDRLSSARKLPERLGVAALNGAPLVESPEPLPWDRLDVQVQQSPVLARQLDEIGLDHASFGTPDIGTFSYAGGTWQTT